MKKKLFALFLAVPALLVSVLCFSETQNNACDSCGYQGTFDVVVTGAETRNGVPGECYELRCPGCGAVKDSSWRQTGPAEPPAGNPDPSGDGGSEPPAAPPSAGDSSGNNEGEPGVPPLPEQEPAAATQPPVPRDRKQKQGGKSPETQSAGEPVPQNPMNDPPATSPPGRGGRPDRRNIRKYPYFSAQYPSRRLDMPGDPDAWAPVPGVKVYPGDPAEGSSILQRMLHGN